VTTQLTLSGIQLRDNATFDSFYPGQNQQVFQFLQNFTEGNKEQFIYLWGNPGSGRSHLLQACCHYANALGKPAMYLPLTELQYLSPQMLQDIEQLGLVCIDDVELIAGNKAWEEALFHLYNRMRQVQTRLLMASHFSHRDITIELPDLRSRLAWGMVFQLYVLNDEDKLAALLRRGQLRGMFLPRDVCQFLLRRCPRNMTDLFHILDELDKASLSQQRRLTIPFVKSVLRV